MSQGRANVSEGNGKPRGQAVLAQAQPKDGQQQTAARLIGYITYDQASAAR
jgi:hypothetical protein